MTKYWLPKQNNKTADTELPHRLTHIYIFSYVLSLLPRESVDRDPLSWVNFRQNENRWLYSQNIKLLKSLARHQEVATQEKFASSWQTWTIKLARVWSMNIGYWTWLLFRSISLPHDYRFFMSISSFSFDHLYFCPFRFHYHLIVTAAVAIIIAIVTTVTATYIPSINAVLFAYHIVLKVLKW